MKFPGCMYFMEWRSFPAHENVSSQIDVLQPARAVTSLARSERTAKRDVGLTASTPFSRDGAPRTFSGRNASCSTRRPARSQVSTCYLPPARAPVPA